MDEQKHRPASGGSWAGGAPPVVGVLGAGSWGTALAKLMADQGFETRLWSRRAEQAEAINRTRKNPSYLREVELPETLRATADMKEALRGVDLVLVVVPTRGTRHVLDEAQTLVPDGVPLVSATKGIEQGTLKLVSGIFEDHWPEERHGQLTYLAGPSFANEVAAGVPTAVILAGKDPKVTKQVQRAFSTERFRAYTSDDVVGVEIGGALKNVVAIATGISDGLGLGQNARAAIITRGLAELGRLARKLGGRADTLAGLSGMGDLVLTCTGDLSRNRRVGLALGRGMTLQAILDELGMVAEGVETAKSAHELAAREGVDMPITREVHAILYEDKPVREAIHALMTRPLKAEHE